MTRIGRSPAAGNLPFLLSTCGIGSLLLAAPTAALFGDSPLRYPLAFGCWLALLLGVSLLYLGLAYRQVGFDRRYGTARLGRTTVPLTSVTRAWRQTSVAEDGSYLSYRFEATSGAWGRVLVAGRPLRGLEDEGRRHLAEFIEVTGIEDVTDAEGLTTEQRYLADALSQYGARSPVGKRTLLAELRGEPIRDPVGPAEPVTAGTHRRWDRDDADAEAFLRTRTTRSRAVRRGFGWLTALAAVVALVLIIVAAVWEGAAGGDLGEDRDATLGAGVFAAMGVGLLAYLGYCVAAWADTRRAQRDALAWLCGRDPGQATRGLPPLLLAPFTGPPPGHRLRTLAAYAAGVLGAFGLIGGPVILFDEEYDPPVGLTVLLAGLVVVATSIALFVAAARARRRQNLLAVRLGGQRLVSEDLVG
jgi:hypothetical protein